ncbi:MAG TPA: FAD-dependent oxidoreductase, partial [Pirellulaceae bacterium]
MEPCDILVIGGGIHGVGVAQAAAAAGYEVTLVEQTALAAGTSSKSSKLIHGGLRYLEQAGLQLVWESLSERERLLKLAPDLVRRIRLLIPVYETTSRRPWLLRSGLSAYTALAGFRRATWFRQLRREEWASLDGLATHGLDCVFEYSDAQTDDAALTRAVMASAESLGARLLCPATFTRGTRTDGGFEVALVCDGRERFLRATTLVNAAGPWANRVLSAVRPAVQPVAVDLVQGTHVELPGALSRGGYYLESPRDHRAIFVLPWRGRTLVGTTEHSFTGNPSDVHPLECEIEYLQNTFGTFFPDRADTVLTAWTGLRVLPASGTQTAFQRSRETQLIGE